MPAWVIHALPPVSTQPSPSRDRPRPHGRGVAARLGLGQAVRREQVAAEQVRQPPGLLLGRARGGQGVAGEHVDAHAHGHRAPAAGQLLEHLQVDDVGLAAAAVLLGVRAARAARACRAGGRSRAGYSCSRAARSSASAAAGRSSPSATSRTSASSSTASSVGRCRSGTGKGRRRPVTSGPRGVRGAGPSAPRWRHRHHNRPALPRRGPPAASMARVSTLLAVDAATLYFRAFYGVPSSVKAPDGTPVNALRGYLDMTAMLLERFAPAAYAACWDADWRPAFRTDLLPSYKAHRVAQEGDEEVPDELSPAGPAHRRGAVAARPGPGRGGRLRGRRRLRHARPGLDRRRPRPGRRGQRRPGPAPAGRRRRRRPGRLRRQGGPGRARDDRGGPAEGLRRGRRARLPAHVRAARRPLRRPAGHRRHRGEERRRPAPPARRPARRHGRGRRPVPADVARPGGRGWSSR